MTPNQRRARAARIAENRAKSGRDEPASNTQAKPRTTRDKLDKLSASPEAQAEKALYSSQRWLTTKARVLRRDQYRCHLCGAGGANSADHILSRAEHPEVEFCSMDNLAAVHSYPKASPLSPPGKPVYCNAVRGGYSVEYGRRKVAEKIAAAGGVVHVSPEDTEQPFIEGREW